MESGAGFTMLELILVLAILALLAAVIIPNVSSFMISGQLAAANKEVLNIKTAAQAYDAKYQQWPVSSGNLTLWLSGKPKGVYIFNTSTGVITSGVGWGPALVFDAAISAQKWEKAPQ